MTWIQRNHYNYSLWRSRRNCMFSSVKMQKKNDQKSVRDYFSIHEAHRLHQALRIYHRRAKVCLLLQFVWQIGLQSLLGGAERFFKAVLSTILIAKPLLTRKLSVTIKMFGFHNFCCTDHGDKHCIFFSWNIL